MISGLKVYTPDDGHTEERGIVYKTSLEATFDFNPFSFVEEKISISKENVLRGFHGDTVTGKLLTCYSGKLKLVVVDRREKSPTFFTGNKEIGYYSTVLSAEENKHVFIPKGCLNAHYVITGPGALHYKLTSKYAGPESQKTVIWNDTIIEGFPEIASPIISDRDAKGSKLEEVIL
tara:strand:+ start:84 stop:611 length:528 start_codon:yes stop_codon:yes gene_type:complete